MSKKATFVLAVGLLSSAVLGATAPVQAATEKDTEATVGYTTGGISLDPGDPEAPNPGDPGYEAGRLPDNLNFGQHEIQTRVDEVWTATSDGDQESAVTMGRVGVSDNRGDASASWQVKVTQQAQFTAGDNELEGASLQITPGEMNNNLGYTLSGPTLDSDESYFSLVPGQEANVLSAAAGTSAGESGLRLDRFDLAVPATTNRAEVNYQATLNWTLSATPGQEDM